MWKWSVGLLVAAVLVLSWSPPETDNNPKPPVDPVVVESMYDRAFRVEAELNRDIRKAAAAKLRAGEFATDRKVFDYLAAEAERAEDAAWQPVLDAEAAALNDGKWTAELHASILEGGTEGHNGDE